MENQLLLLIKEKYVNQRWKCWDGKPDNKIDLILKKENNNSTDSNNSNENNSNEKQGNQNNNSQTSNLDVIVVSNGKISDSSCRLFEISHDDIKKAAKKKHMKLKDIFVMTANENGDFKIVKKEKQKKWAGYTHQLQL